MPPGLGLRTMQPPFAHRPLAPAAAPLPISRWPALRPSLSSARRPLQPLELLKFLSEIVVSLVVSLRAWCGLANSLPQLVLLCACHLTQCPMFVVWCVIVAVQRAAILDCTHMRTCAVLSSSACSAPAPVGRSGCPSQTPLSCGASWQQTALVPPPAQQPAQAAVAAAARQAVQLHSHPSRLAQHLRWRMLAVRPAAVALLLAARRHGVQC